MPSLFVFYILCVDILPSPHQFHFVLLSNSNIFSEFVQVITAIAHTSTLFVEIIDRISDANKGSLFINTQMTSDKVLVALLTCRIFAVSYNHILPSFAFLISSVVSGDNGADNGDTCGS